jgi:translocation and assembly module TamB
MSRRARRMWIAAGSLVAVALLVALSAILVLRSDWFSEKVRDRIVAEVEKATGGRSEIAAFRFDWKQLRAQVDGFVLHGTEPADAPPLVRADAIVVGIKIVSVLKRSVDLQYVDVRHPQAYVILYPDGHTNVPAPKVKRAGKGTVATILDLAIGRFSLQDGSFEVPGQGMTPFDAQGRNLRAQFTYDVAGPRYRTGVHRARQLSLGRLPACSAGCEPGAGRGEESRRDRFRTRGHRAVAGRILRRGRQPHRCFGIVPI